MKENDVKKGKTTKGSLVAVALCLIAAAGLAIFGNSSQHAQEPSSQKPSIEEMRAIKEAFARGGLREVARLKGGVYVYERDPHWKYGMFDIENLTKNSAAVIVGRFRKQLDGRLIDGRVINTDYEVAVEELVKGDLKQAKTIVVTVPGGRVFFDDGTSVEERTPKFEHPHIGRAYAVFLMEETAFPSIFFLAGGPAGLFDIENSASVKSHGRPDDVEAVETRGKSRDEFMKNVREYARKWPKPGRCCG
jgi:hypothetical protein